MDQTAPVFDLHCPPDWTGIIIAAPHSGRYFPDWFLREAILPLHLLRSSEDPWLDLLIAGAARHGAAVLTARVSRAVVDLNRADSDLDPLLIQGLPRRVTDARVASGLGVIPRVVSRGRAIFPPLHRIPRPEAQARLAALWQPYHATLAALMARGRAQFGRAILLDIHSMPHEAVASQPPPMPQVVLGNRYGASATAEISDTVAEILHEQGFTLRHNNPFAGAHILSAHGLPRIGQHAIQLEFDRNLYLQADGLTPSDGYDDFARRLDAALAGIIARLAPSQRLAAE
ncbi:MAG: N-formylglutamate amidohydrolase [Paracoccus sp. (in: a-proteobacteria)]|uniref:N-formylglutamate amidohydrolase n=1 Tax=Paracoccus sp. TaxID=267 RepID=UPI0026DF13D1|nr:N-formylglutamate amidohydrolase [Paracoccus sp. (in: a-proteobacteria)]MDO5620810.1 N-formylglutamate amidohydrolase [Paracoccus sp. (in: a-proteobacteria)]